MKTIKATLPDYLSELELHIFADEHIGDEFCDLDRLKKRIKYVVNKPNAYCVLNGDIIDNATRSSIGDCYSSSYQPMEQLRIAFDLFSPLKDKILCITHGNHEGRTYKADGINLSELLARQLNLFDIYTPTSAIIFLRFGKEAKGIKETNGSGRIRKICYTIYMLHGSGGGRRAGSKINRLEDMSNIIDADVYIHSHTHLPMIMKEGFFRIDPRNSSVKNVPKLFVNTASNLDYGGYGEAAEFRASCKDTPIIVFDGTGKHFEARL